MSSCYTIPDSLHNKRLELVDSYIAGGRNLLDFGTGTGELIKREEHKFDNLYGVDSDEESITICRNRFKGDSKVHIIHDHGKNLDICLPDIRFDYITACDVLEHMKLGDSVQVLKLFYDLIKLRGTFIFTGPGVFEKAKIGLGRSPTHVHSHSSFGWAKLIRQGGFEIVKVEAVEFPLYDNAVLRNRLHVFGRCCVITAEKR
jgi:predicted TPR repeat methyltransferase